MTDKPEEEQTIKIERNGMFAVQYPKDWPEDRQKALWVIVKEALEANQQGDGPIVIMTDTDVKFTRLTGPEDDKSDTSPPG